MSLVLGPLAEDQQLVDSAADELAQTRARTGRAATADPHLSQCSTHGEPAVAASLECVRLSDEALEPIGVGTFMWGGHGECGAPSGGRLLDRGGVGDAWRRPAREA